MKSIYLDHQSTTPLSASAAAAMQPFWQEHYGNPHSGEHSFGWQAANSVLSSKQQVADILNATENEVILTSGATEANSQALLGYALKANAEGRPIRILTSAIEHKSILNAAQQVATLFGADINILPVDQNGLVDLEALDRGLGAGPALVSIGAVNGEIGTIERIDEIAAAVRRYDGIFHTDASQASTSIDLIDLLDHCDLISLSAHKVYGPKGVGALIGPWQVTSNLVPLMIGGGQQSGLRGGTVPTALASGFAAALIEYQNHLEDNVAHLGAQSAYLLSGLRGILPDLKVVGPAKRHAGNLSVSFSGIDAKALLSAIQPTVCASTGSACASGAEGPSHVLSAIGLPVEEGLGVIRFSVGLPTSSVDLDYALEVIDQAIREAPGVRL